MNLRTLRFVFVGVSLLLIYVFFDSLPTTRSSDQIRFEEWNALIGKDPVKLQTVRMHLALSLPSMPVTEYLLEGKSSPVVSQQVRRLLDLIDQGNLLSLQSRSGDATVKLGDATEGFSLTFDSHKAQSVPAAGLFLKLFIEYASANSAATSTPVPTLNPVATPGESD